MNIGSTLAKNIILYGPPGTGKTYNTVMRAVEIIDGEDKWKDKNYSEIKKRYDELLRENRIAFVTFHQSYGYEEFIEGIKPKTTNDEVTYEVQPGAFKYFCQLADDSKAKGEVEENRQTKKYVFIIDEINRGNISKIFGELITLIEENKRESAKEATSVKLPYSKTNFSVPDNVYIIGTMNTADRSIAAIDTALRRRFKFEEMMPKSDVIKCKNIDGIDIPKMLDRINERIEVLYDREHTIGHAYFMSLEESATIKELSDIFRNKIIPLLQEYFYEDYEKICLVLGDNQKKEEYRFIKSEDINYAGLFGSSADVGFGEKSKKFFVNDDAFLNENAYIGIYDPNNK